MTPNRERFWVGLFVVIVVAVLSATAVAVWGGMGRSGVAHRAYFKLRAADHEAVADLQTKPCKESRVRRNLSTCERCSPNARAYGQHN